MAPETPLVTGVDFAVVPTEDFDCAIEFYGEVLGLPCSARYGRIPGAEFETGTLTLAVLEAESFGLAFNPNTNGITLRVDDVVALARNSSRAASSSVATSSTAGPATRPTSPTGTGTRSSLHNRYAPRD
jgi:predicted enzyme related to lactoylglutathione lyase